MISEIYKKCMLVGNRWEQKYGNNEDFDEWCGTEECATLAELVYHICETLNVGMEKVLADVMNIIIQNGFYNVIDHGYDDYARGFLAGQILGLPTSDNIDKAEKAEWLWNHDDGDTYGYYQEVLNEVK